MTGFRAPAAGRVRQVRVSTGYGRRLLLDHGFVRARPLAGGLEEWARAGHRIDKHPASPTAPADDSVPNTLGSKYGP